MGLPLKDRFIMSFEVPGKYSIILKGREFFLQEILKRTPDATFYSASFKNNEICLVKVFEEENTDQFNLEVSSISAIRKHPYLLEFIDSDSVYFKNIILYSLPSTHAFDPLPKSKFSDPTLVVTLFMQLLSVFSHIHTSGYVHLNLSSENIGFDKGLMLKLFGFNEMRKFSALKELTKKQFNYFSGAKSPRINKIEKYLFLGPALDMTYLGEFLTELDLQQFICGPCMDSINAACKKCEIWKTLKFFEKRLKNDSPLMRGNLREMVFVLLSKKQLKKIPVFKQLEAEFKFSNKELEYQRVLDQLFSETLQGFDLAVFTRILSEINLNFKNFRDMAELIENSSRVNLNSYATVLKVLTFVYFVYVSGNWHALNIENKLGFIDKIMQIWLSAAVAAIKELTEYVSIIKAFIHVVQAKFYFHIDSNSLAEWSVVSLNNNVAPTRLVSYWKRIREFHEVILENPSILFNLREMILNLLYFEVSSFYSKAESVVRTSPCYANDQQALIMSYERLGKDLRLALSFSMTKKVFDPHNFLYPKSYLTKSYNMSLRTPLIILVGKKQLKAEFIGVDKFNIKKTKIEYRGLNDVIFTNNFIEGKKVLVHLVQRLNIESASCGDEFFTLADRISNQYVLNIAGHEFSKKGLKLVSLDIFDCSLFKALHELEVKFSITEKIVIALDIADGMDHLTKLGLTHMNLRSDHVFLENFECDANKPLLVKIYNYSSLFRTIQISHQPYEALSWDSPEVLQGAIFNQFSDVYSYGLLLWELLTGSIITDLEIHISLINAEMVQFDNEMNFANPDLAQIKILIQRCVSNDLSLRPTFKEIKEILKSILN